MSRENEATGTFGYFDRFVDGCFSFAEQNGNDLTKAGVFFAAGTLLVGLWCKVTDGKKFAIERVGRGWPARPKVPDGSHDFLPNPQTIEDINLLARYEAEFDVPDQSSVVNHRVIQ